MNDDKKDQELYEFQVSVKGKKSSMTWKERLFPYKPWYRNLWFRDYRDAILFFMVLLLSFSYYHDTKVFREVYENPCVYCAAYVPQQTLCQGDLQCNNGIGMFKQFNASPIMLNKT